MAPTEVDVRAAAAAVEDPTLRRGLGELGMVRSVQSGRRRVAVVVAVPVERWPAAEELVDLVIAAVGAVPGVGEVTVEVAVMTGEERQELHRRLALGARGRARRADRPRWRRPCPHPRARWPAGSPRARGGPAQPVHGPGIAHPGGGDLVGQGGRGEVVGDGEPGRRPGGAGP